MASSQPGSAVADPAVAATVRLLHRRQGWGRVAVTGFIASLLVFGGSASADSQGTPPPFWFTAIGLVLGALTVVGIVASLIDSRLLRRRPAAVRAQAVPLAAHHPRRAHPHHYPPRHWVTWAACWVGMLLILVVGVVSVSGVVDGAAYLAGAGHTVTFDPLSYQTNCQYRTGCQTSTEGILETGGAGLSATWPDVVPLGKSFRVREPVWRWGLGGGSLIDSDRIAVVAILVSLLIEGFAVVVVWFAVRLARNWHRHRRSSGPGLAQGPVPLSPA